MKRFFIPLFALCILAACFVPAGCAPQRDSTVGAGGAVAIPDYQWRFTMPEVRERTSQSMELMCDLIEKYSEGKIQVDYYPDGLLGAYEEAFHGVQSGDIEMGYLGYYSNVVPGAATYLPWQVTSYDESAVAYGYPDGPLFRLMSDAWEEVGIKCFWAATLGPYGIANNVRPLKTPEDFAGWKFRVSGAVGYVKTMQNMSAGTGMTLETVPWSELYTALQTGVVDACWDTWPTLIEARHIEVVKYYTTLNFGWDVASVCMNLNDWNALSPQLQDAIVRAGQVAEARHYEVHRRAELEYREAVKAAGVEIYNPTPEERMGFYQSANMPAIWAELANPWLEKRYPGQNMMNNTLSELEAIRAKLA